MNAAVTTTPQTQHSPADRDRSAVAWFEQRCGLKLADRQISFENPSLTEKVFVASRPNPDVALATRWASELLTAAPDSDLEKALATLSLLVAKRPNDDGSDELQLAAYVTELRRYPADIAMHAVSNWHRTSKFWPTWLELQEQLDAMFAFRRRLLWMLQNIEYPPAQPDERPTDADVADVKAIRDRTLAALQSSGKPKRPERGVIDDRLDAAREHERAQAAAILHPEPEAQP